jgi:hypothetical protein
MSNKNICPSAGCNYDMSDGVVAECKRPEVIGARFKVVQRQTDEKDSASRVSLKCPKGHLAEYSCDDETPPRLLLPGEVDQLVALQGAFSPVESLKRVDDFAKWLFATVAVVGSLGAGLSVTKLEALSPIGKYVFGGAVLLVGLSLGAATFALQPRWMHARFSSRDSLLEALEGNLAKRRRPIRCAGVLFAIAVWLAALAPVVSAMTMRSGGAHVTLGYSWKPDGVFSTQMKGFRLAAYAPVELSVRSTGASAAEQACVHKAADPEGDADVVLEIVVPSAPGTGLQVVGKWGDAVGANAPLAHEESVTAVVPLAKIAGHYESNAKIDTKRPTPPAIR